MSSPQETVTRYIIAKDGNRPHLLARVFTGDAVLETSGTGDAVAMPARTEGRETIEDTAVRRFAAEFENIYTFALVRPVARDRRHFVCPFLVGMSARKDGTMRVGCGRYDWHFAEEEACRAERLEIAVETMQVLAAEHEAAVTDWLAALPYPWCSPATALARMPDLEALEPLRQALAGAALPGARG